MAPKSDLKWYETRLIRSTSAFFLCYHIYNWPFWVHARIILLLVLCTSSGNSPCSVFLPRVEGPITNHSRDFTLALEKYKVVQIFPWRRDWNQEDHNFFFGNFILWIKMIMKFWSQKLARTYYQCLESIIPTHFKCLFLLILALETRTCVMALWTTWSKFNPNHIEI